MSRVITLLAIGITSLLYYSCSDKQSVSSVDPDESGIFGTVVTSEDANPVEGALLKLSGNSIDMETKSNQDGEFEFTTLDDGNYEITIYLPLGYNFEGEKVQEVLVEGMSEVQFTAIPIKEEERVIKAGSVDTLATASGAMVMIDASETTSDMNVKLRDIEENRFEGEEILSQNFEIIIGAEGNSNSTSNAQKVNEEDLANISIFVPYAGDPDETTLMFNSGSKVEPFFTFAKGERVQVTDSRSGTEKTVYQHNFFVPNSYNMTTIVAAASIDMECDNSFREFVKIENSLQGDIPLVLIHGIDPTSKNCESVNDHDPQTDTFQDLISELEKNPEISQNYELYIYEYPSHTSIEENSLQLLEYMKDLDEAVIIAHSMGGLVTRSLMIEDDNHVGKLITLGTPHEGSPMADILTSSSLERALLSLRFCNLPFDRQGCNALTVESFAFPRTQGILDLKKDGAFISNLNNADKFSDKVHTFGGLLKDSDEIGNYDGIVKGNIKRSVYRLGYRYMSEVLEKSGDGMVETSSSMPEWSNSKEILTAHDHTEMVIGQDGDIASIFGKIEPILMKYIQDENSGSDKFFLAENGVTVKCPEAEIGEEGTINGITYIKRNKEQITTSNASSTCTSGITDMSQMFYGDSNFNQDIGSWDVSNVTTMKSMFFGAEIFNQDIGNWNVEKVTNMIWMFVKAENFNHDIGGWDVGNVTNMRSMFAQASSFNQNIGDWNVGNVINMAGIFRSAENFNQDINNWNVGNVNDMSAMFNNAHAFDHYIGGWDVSAVTNMRGMFFRATSFNQNLDKWDVSNVTNMSSMFWMASSFNGKIDNWNVGNVKNMKFMFAEASSFNKDIDNWDVGNVTNMSSMFTKAIAFNQDLNGWEVSNVKYMGGMFGTAKSFNGDIGNWDVSSVTEMTMMFQGASSFNQEIGGWDVGNVTGMREMFQGASTFNRNIGDWQVGNVENMDEMFLGAEVFNQDLSSWCVTNITSEPSGFSYGSPLLPAYHPIWGTCPE